jgi:hypothetical protein
MAGVALVVATIVMAAARKQAAKAATAATGVISTVAPATAAAPTEPGLRLARAERHREGGADCQRQGTLFRHGFSSFPKTKPENNSID